MSSAWGPGGPDRIRPGLDRILAAVERTGHPERSFPAIHIAGTNGKGSTATFCESILGRLLPAPVGLYTSPHLLSPTERIRVGSAQISQKSFDEELSAAERISRAVAKTVGDPLSWFEALTWAAFDWFRKRGVGLAIFEVGLGGRWDATSVCLPAVSVITSVGLDHREWLGSTLAEIAAEKAGILRDRIPVLLGSLPPTARRVILRVARERKCPVWETGRDLKWELDVRGRTTVILPEGVTVRNVKLGMLGGFQAGNAALSCAAAWIVARCHGIPGSRFSRAAREGLATARLPGRYSPLPGPGNPRLWVDGGHNPDAAAAISRTLGPRTPGTRTIALWSMLRDKDLRRYVRSLSPSVDGWVAYPMEQERAAPLDALVAVLENQRVPWQTAEDFRDGWDVAREWSGRRGRVIVCGSLMAAADAYRYRRGSLP